MNKLKGFLNKNILPIGIFIASFIYYYSLSAKQLTWLFASGDSGNWLATSTLWTVPQPYGSPLYIVLGHFLNLFGGDLVFKMTTFLSVLPAAITVTLIYLIVKRLTDSKDLAVLGSLILLGTAIFLSQATILEEYSIAVMFVTAGYYFYLKDNKYLTALMLGLGTAIHIVVPVLSILWLIFERKNIKAWLKPIALYIAVGIMPYFLTLYLLSLSTPHPPVFGGNGLNLKALMAYLASTKVVGSLPVLSFPERLLEVVTISIMSFGLALVPMLWTFKRPYTKAHQIALISIIFPFWYWATCLDPTVYTFMSYACPFVAITACVGLNKLDFKVFFKHFIPVALSALLLILVNATFLNANILTNKNPVATLTLEATNALPDGSYIVCTRGGAKCSAAWWAYAQGKDLKLIFLDRHDRDINELTKSYVKWVNEYYEIDGGSTLDFITELLNRNEKLYITYPLYGEWEGLLITDNSPMPYSYTYEQVIGIEEGAYEKLFN